MIILEGRVEGHLPHDQGVLPRQESHLRCLEEAVTSVAACTCPLPHLLWETLIFKYVLAYSFLDASSLQKWSWAECSLGFNSHLCYLQCKNEDFRLALFFPASPSASTLHCSCAQFSPFMKTTCSSRSGVDAAMIVVGVVEVAIENTSHRKHIRVSSAL